MAYGGRTEIGIKKTSSPCTVPDDDRARLMYYLNCICSILDFGDTGEVRRLRQYNNYYLSDEKERTLIALCYTLSPDVLNNKCIFNVENQDRGNAMYELSAVRTQFVVTPAIFIGGQQRRVTEIMTYTTAWIMRYWYHPMQVCSNTISILVIQSYHIICTLFVTFMLIEFTVKSQIIIYCSMEERNQMYKVCIF